jgi:hypothetical protein
MANTAIKIDCKLAGRSTLPALSVHMLVMAKVPGRHRRLLMLAIGSSSTPGELEWHDNHESNEEEAAHQFRTLSRVKDSAARHG